MPRIRSVALVSFLLSVNGPIFAQVNPEHVISDVERLAKRGVSDKKIARRVAELRPTYYISEISIEELEKKQPIGPRTLFALHVLASQSMYLDPSPGENRPADAVPDPASAEKLAQSI